ncbi:hypothetical protein [uncultured Ruminococcus sp.]|uniref:hypothetical protein n=1 Tax=uncultured Ruminococcus sp. TaxID=165186 RepID=UPI0025CEAF42|nr:hypothetical protein [uncultured Ruminococcus sp.]
MKKMINNIKKQWLHIWIVFAIIALSSMGAMAVYISANSTMKRVVVSTSSQGKLFSSNVLVEDGINTYIPRYFPSLTDKTQTYPVDVYLWNYSLTNPARWYSDDIDYTITFTLTDSEGTPLDAATIGSRTVIIADKYDNTLATLNGTTPILTYTKSTESLDYNASLSAENHYTMKYSGNWDLDNDTDICVKVDVQLENGGDTAKYQDLSPLGGIIGLKRSVSTESTGWQAYISEQADSKTVTDCDGYNMVVSGSGAAIITIKWDTRYLDCNKSFYDNSIYSFGTYSDSTKEVSYTAPETGSNIATLVIKADTASAVTSNRNRYDIQFYKTGTGESADWSFITNTESSLSDSVWLYINVVQ